MLSRLSSARVGVGIPLALPLTAALAIVLAGCGSSGESLTSKSATEILAASRAAALHASSVRIAEQRLSRQAVAHLQPRTGGKRHPCTDLLPRRHPRSDPHRQHHLCQGQPRLLQAPGQTHRHARASGHVGDGARRQAAYRSQTALSSELTLLLSKPRPAHQGPHHHDRRAEGHRTEGEGQTLHRLHLHRRHRQALPDRDRQTRSGNRPDHLHRLEPAHHPHRAHRRDRTQQAQTQGALR